MNCKKKDLQMLVDWLHAAHEYMFQNVVMVWVNLLGGGTRDSFATGFLTYIPTHAIGFPPGPNRSDDETTDYFQGNLVNTMENTIEGPGHSHLIIEMADPVVNLYLLNVKNNQIETVRMKSAPCEKSGQNLKIKTEGDDGLSYEILLSARKVLAVPHQVIWQR